MLVEQHIVSRNAAREILPVLLELRRGGIAAVPINHNAGSLLLQIEAVLCNRLGENIAGRLHTARSRIDQGTAARRLYQRDKLLGVFASLTDLQRVVLETAAAHASTMMPTYTHLQQAQPGIFGHYLLGIADRLHDDFQRLTSAYKRTNLNCLGAVGLAGTSWPIDRHRTAELLGFDDLVYNSKIGREAYYAAEIASCLAMTMSTLNDLATDLHIWSSSEFSLVQLDDSYCSTSSIFPQKKNPVALEYIKEAAGMAVTWGSTALATFRGEGTGDQHLRSVPLLDQAFDTVANMLDLAGGITGTLQVNTQRMAELLETSWSTSSNLADVLVRDHGLSFRQAHHAVARLVRICEQEGVCRPSVTPQHLARATRETLEVAVQMDADELRRALSPREFIRTRASVGSVGPTEVAVLLDLGRERSKMDALWLRQAQRRLVEADVRLASSVDALLNFQ